MRNLFNTSFEISLRVLLTLEAAPRLWMSADWITAADFITVYSRDFDIADENLHGENSYKYSEFTLRREIVKQSLRTLVFRSLVDVKSTPDGFVYALGKNGGDYCGEIEGSYAQAYRELAVKVRSFLSGKTEHEVLRLICLHSISSIQRSYRNE